MRPAEVMLTSRRQPAANNCSATSTANDAPTAQPTTPKRIAGVIEHVQRGVVAGPSGVRRRAPGGAQPAHDVAVRVEQADIRHRLASGSRFRRRASRSRFSGRNTEGDA